MDSVEDKICTEASYHALKLKVLLCSREDVINWADSWILRLENPPYKLLEVSTYSDPHIYDLIQLLQSFSGTEDKNWIWSSITGEYLKILKKDPSSDGNIVGNLYLRLIDYVPEDCLEFLRWVEYELELAFDGIADRVSAQKELIKFLQSQSTTAR